MLRGKTKPCFLFHSTFIHILFETKTKGEKIMKALLIHTDGYSIDVVGKYNTKEEASRALYKEFEKMCSQGIDPEWQERSHCDYEDAILYLNGEDVHVWQVVTA